MRRGHQKVVGLKALEHLLSGKCLGSLSVDEAHIRKRKEKTVIWRSEKVNVLAFQNERTSGRMVCPLTLIAKLTGICLGSPIIESDPISVDGMTSGENRIKECRWTEGKKRYEIGVMGRTRDITREMRDITPAQPNHIFWIGDCGDIDAYRGEVE
jgi:hypothetical protein